jgi:hypothetical protein
MVRIGRVMLLLLIVSTGTRGDCRVVVACSTARSSDGGRRHGDLHWMLLQLFTVRFA